MSIVWSPSKSHFKFVTSVPFTHDPITNVDFYLQKVNNTLIVCFQSTNGNKDWQSDFDYLPKTFDIYPGSSIKVHEGLAKQYLGCRKSLLDAAYSEDINRIFIAGYSLGGGLAQLACEDVAYHLPDKEIISISYEGPRVFSPNIAVSSLIKDRQTLIKTFWDPVCHVPFKFFLNPGLSIKSIDPLKLSWGFPSLTLWRDYGKVIWIGRWNKLYPLQHDSDQIEQNLLTKFGE